MEALQGAVQDGGVPHEANYHYCFGAEDASRIGWLERTLRERCDVSKTCAAWADGLKRAIVVALRHRKWCAEASLAKLSPTSLEACGNNMC